MEWHSRKVTETRILVIGIISSKCFIKGKEILFEVAGNSSYPSTSCRGSTVNNNNNHK